MHPQPVGDRGCGTAHEQRPRDAVGPAQHHRAGVLDRARVAPCAVGPDAQPEPVPPIGAREGDAGRASVHLGHHGGRQRMPAGPARVERVQDRHQVLHGGDPRARRAEGLHVHTARCGGVGDVAGADVLGAGHPHVRDAERGEQAVLHHLLVRPPRDLLDDQAEDAVVHVAVAVHRARRAGEPAGEPRPCGLVAARGTAAEERGLVLGEP